MRRARRGQVTTAARGRAWIASGTGSGRRRGRDAELALLEHRPGLGVELVVQEDVLAGELRRPLRALRLVADEMGVRVLHALAVLVHRVAEVTRLLHVEELPGRLVELVDERRLHALR